jgi:hypothetical protein
MTPDQVAQAIAFEDGFWAGWHARRDVADELEDRDERMGRRLVAAILQYANTKTLIESVIRTAPYANRGVPRQGRRLPERAVIR